MIKVEFFNIINKDFKIIQKFVAVFVLIMILFNVFIPKNQEIRSNFMVALNCVVNTVETNFYDQYSKVVMSVINSILSNFNIETIAEVQLSKQQSQKADNNVPIPVNTSADNCVIMQNNTGSQIETLKANISYLIYETINKLYNVYESIKLNDSKETSTMGILFFILFSILVVRIKDTIAVILNKKYRILNRLA